MSFIKALGQFVLGLIGWVITPIALVALVFRVSIFLDSPIYLSSPIYAILLFPVLFLIGIGLAALFFRKENLRWIGIGIAVALVLHAIGVLVRAWSDCPPFLLPFPLSLMIGC